MCLQLHEHISVGDVQAGCNQHACVDNLFWMRGCTCFQQTNAVLQVKPDVATLPFAAGSRVQHSATTDRPVEILHMQSLPAADFQMDRNQVQAQPAFQPMAANSEDIRPIRQEPMAQLVQQLEVIQYGILLTRWAMAHSQCQTEHELASMQVVDAAGEQPASGSAYGDCADSLVQALRWDNSACIPSIQSPG